MKKIGVLLSACLLIFVFCSLPLICFPFLAAAENAAFVGLEDVQQTWLDNGTHIIFSRGDNELSFFDSQGLKTASFQPDEPLTRIWSVYYDDSRIHLLAATETDRFVISLENGLFATTPLPEERIKGLVFPASGGAYYRTKEDHIGYFGFRAREETVYGDVEIGGLYALTSGYGIDVLYVSEKQTKENIIIGIQNGCIIWQYKLPNSDGGTMRLPGAMKLTDAGELLAAIGDMSGASKNHLYCLSEGKLQWMAPVFDGNSFCVVDKIIVTEDSNIHLIGTNGAVICYAIYAMNGTPIHENKIEKKCPFNLFIYENGKIYGLDEAGEQRIIVIDSL